MKKVCLVFVMVGLFFSIVFSEETKNEVVSNGNTKLEKLLIPKLGFGNASLKLEDGDKVTWKGFSMGLDFSIKLKNNLTLMLNNNFIFGGKLNYSGFTKECKGAFWNGSFLCGYTFAVNSKMTFVGGVGLGVSVGKPKITYTIFNKTKTREGKLSSFGMPIYLGFNYFFNPKFGITTTLTDVLSKGKYSVDGTELGSGFTNVFFLQIGPSFRF